MHFTLAKLRGQSVGRPSNRVGSSIGGTFGKPSKASKKNKKDKQKQQKHMDRKGGAGRESEHASVATAAKGTGSAEALLPAVAAPTTPHVSRTAAGDGGRWVHVPA